MRIFPASTGGGDPGKGRSPARRNNPYLSLVSKKKEEGALHFATTRDKNPPPPKKTKGPQKNPPRRKKKRRFGEKGGCFADKTRRRGVDLRKEKKAIGLFLLGKTATGGYAHRRREKGKGFVGGNEGPPTKHRQVLPGGEKTDPLVKKWMLIIKKGGRIIGGCIAASRREPQRRRNHSA